MKLKKGKSDDTKSGFYQTCNKFQNVKDIVEFQLIFIKLYGWNLTMKHDNLQRETNICVENMYLGNSFKNFFYPLNRIDK